MARCNTLQDVKKTALMALLPLLLLGCKDRDDSSKTDTAPKTEQTQTDQKDQGEQATDAASKDTKPAEPAEVTKPGPVPAGYTRVKDLSDKPVRTFKAEPDFQLEDGKDYAAVVDTNRGQMVIDLFEDVPTSTNNFVWLARHNYYDGLLFHRVIEGFVVQGGDPNTATANRETWGQGGPGYGIPLEVRSKYNFDEKGILGMARAQDPNSGGSQFYITLAPASNLNSQYTVFGKVTQGLDVLDKITKYEAPAEGQPDKMLDVYIVTKNK